MPGTVKIWWHDGALNDVRRNPAPIVNEPELGYEEVAVSASPATSLPAPDDSFIAVIESDVDLRYFVRLPGDNRDADAASKPIARTGHATDFIAIAPNCTISFVEA